MAETAIDICDVVKVFGSGAEAVTALSQVSLAIRDNEFFTLLGPSGCGKTTLLRMIAGFETVSEGIITLYGEEIKNLPANKRPVNTVFQQYALFPHMTVADNIAFGLRRLGQSKADVAARTSAMLSLVQLTDLASRKPAQLSGGQQQRVALARALAPAPKVLLLDEPLSALDLKLRQAMRVELKQIQEETGITFVFVTHDQEEALTMSDRIAVMSAGTVQQIGTAEEIYDQPSNRFVADFIGETNLLNAKVDKTLDGQTLCRLASGSVLACPFVDGASEGDSVVLSIRPERLSLKALSGAAGDMTGTIERLVYLGTDTQYQTKLEDGTLITARVQNAHESAVGLKVGDRAAVIVDDGAARLLVG